MWKRIGKKNGVWVRPGTGLVGLVKKIMYGTVGSSEKDVRCGEVTDDEMR